MPIEIRELIIKSFVDNQNNKNVRKSKKGSFNNSVKKQTIEESLSRVVELVKNKNER